MRGCERADRPGDVVGRQRPRVHVRECRDPTRVGQPADLLDVRREDVDATVVDERREGLEAVEVLAGADRRRRALGDSRDRREILRRRRILEPEHGQVLERAGEARSQSAASIPEIAWYTVPPLDTCAVARWRRRTSGSTWRASRPSISGASSRMVSGRPGAQNASPQPSTPSSLSTRTIVQS